MAVKIRRAAIACVLGMCALTGVARAQPVVSVSPNSVTLPVGRSTPTYTLRWQMDTQNQNLPFNSPSGVFTSVPGGVVLGTNPQGLLVTGPNLGATTLAVVTERLRVPPAVLSRALDMKATAVRYSRFFLDSVAQQSNTASVDLALSGGLAGPFELLYFELMFDDESSIRLVAQEEDLRAIARFSYSGTGRIEVIWEVSDSGSTAGQPIFRQLRRERRFLPASGRARLESPPLPTSADGLHLVRLRVIQPDSSFPLPIIRYFVKGDRAPGRATAPIALQLFAPPERAPLAPDTRFAWAQVKGTGAYQLEIYARDEPAQPPSPDQVLPPTVGTVLLAEDPQAERRVTGALLPSDQREVELSPAVRERLVPGNVYLWKVRALADDGSVLGESRLRELRIPPAPLGARLDPSVTPSP